MKKNKKLYYYEYDENKEILKVTEGVYQETKNKLLILDNIYIPKSMVHTNKSFSEFNCKIINKKLSRIKGDKFLYAMPFVTGIYRNIYHKFFKNAFTFISKNLRLYFLGTLKLPFIPFIRYFENRKEMSNIKIKIRLFEKSAEHYKKLSEAQMPQNEKDLYKTLGGISFDDIKKKYKKEYQQLQSELQKLKAEKDNIKNKETDLSNMTFSLIISFSSLLVAVIALILTCRQSKENYKSETVQNYNTETTEEIKTSEKFDKLPDEEIDNSIIYDLEIKNDFTKPIIEAKSGIKNDNVPVFKEYREPLKN